MPAYTLKGISEELLQRLRMRAERNRRSLNAEMLEVLDVATRRPPVDVEALVARAAAVRESMPGVWVTDEELKRAKEEGRP